MFKKILTIVTILIISSNVNAIAKPQIQGINQSRDVVLEEAYGYLFKSPLSMEDIGSSEIRQGIERERERFLSNKANAGKSFNVGNFIKSQLFEVRNRDMDTNWEHMFVATNSNGEIVKLTAYKRSASISGCRNEARKISDSLKRKYHNPNRTSYSNTTPYYSLRNLKNGTIELECSLNRKNYSYISLSITYTVF